MHTLVAPMINCVLLPLSIFEGAFNTQRRNFWSQFGYSVIFAVAGTLGAAFLLGGAIVATGPTGLNLHPIAGGPDPSRRGCVLLPRRPTSRAESERSA